jgi:hypothetical protein
MNRIAEPVDEWIGTRETNAGEIRSASAFRQRARRLGFSESEIDRLVKLYGYRDEERADEYR